MEKGLGDPCLGAELVPSASLSVTVLGSGSLGRSYQVRSRGQEAWSWGRGARGRGSDLTVTLDASLDSEDGLDPVPFISPPLPTT